MTGTTAETLVETGEHEQALAIAGELAALAETSGDALNLTTVQTVQAHDPHPAWAGHPGR